MSGYQHQERYVSLMKMEGLYRGGQMPLSSATVQHGIAEPILRAHLVRHTI